MVIDRTGAGDPVRTLGLLWREAPEGSGRGPGRGLTVDAVVDAATALADAEGLDGLTMRRVAADLGVAPMTLYTYVPGKAELLDLMLDAAYLRMPRADSTGRPWRARLAAVAGENRELYAAHPWAAGVSTVRPPLGPGLLAKYEHELAPLEGLGLTDLEMDAALTFVLGFVQNWAREAAEARAQRAGRPTDEQWWTVAGPALARRLDPAGYPLAARVGTAAGETQGAAYDPARAFEFGLARVLDGLSVLVEARGTRGTG